MSQTQDQETAYEVVINPDERMNREHADLLRRRLINDGFHERVVSVRPTGRQTDDISISWDSDGVMIHTDDGRLELNNGQVQALKSWLCTIPDDRYNDSPE